MNFIKVVSCSRECVGLLYSFILLGVGWECDMFVEADLRACRCCESTSLRRSVVCHFLHLGFRY